MAGRSSGASWHESVSLTHLAMLGLEAGIWQETLARAAELRAVASKLGDGSEGVIADALDALAVHGAGRPEGRGRVDAALKALEIADAKAILAFSLTLAAEIAIATDDRARAASLAARALSAAEAMGKPSAIILAHVALGHVAADAAPHLAAARALVDHPYGISRRAREALARLASDSNADSNDGSHGGGAKRSRR